MPLLHPAGKPMKGSASDAHHQSQHAQGLLRQRGVDFVDPPLMPVVQRLGPVIQRERALLNRGNGITEVGNSKSCGCLWQIRSPLVSEKEEVPDCDRDRLKQDQPAHETPRGLRSALLQSHRRLQRRLRKNKRGNHLPRFLPAYVSLHLNLFDRFAAVALRQRLQGFLGKFVFHSSFLRHGDR